MNNETNTTQKFQVGKTYYTTSACDSECYFRYTVKRRTEKSVWFIPENSNKIKRCKIGHWNNSEIFYPLGHYSMAPVIRAEKVQGEN